MPKQKTHKGTRKRVKITGSGRVKRRQAGSRHLLSGKNAKRKRHLKQSAMQDDAAGVKLAQMASGF